MRRWIAILWHASFLVIAGALYFFFVLPRWFELTGSWGLPLGLSMRIVCGALIGLAALPVVFTLLRTRKPELGTPQLALTLRFWSIVLHVLAGVLIIGAAISELWLSLDDAGVYLFGVYGAAAAVALLGALSFYLAFAAELPPPPPKPLRPKVQTRGRRRGKRADADQAADDEDEGDEDDDADVVDGGAAAGSVSLTKPSTSTDVETSDTAKTPPNSDKSATPPDADGDDSSQADPFEAPKDVPMSTVKVDVDTDYDEPSADATSSNGSGNADESEVDEQGDKLRNRRPGGKTTSRLFGRSRRGIALDD